MTVERKIVTARLLKGSSRCDFRTEVVTATLEQKVVTATFEQKVVIGTLDQKVVTATVEQNVVTRLHNGK